MSTYARVAATNAAYKAEIKKTVAVLMSGGLTAVLPPCFVYKTAIM